MKLSAAVVVVISLGWHCAHGSLSDVTLSGQFGQECDCDCRCRSTVPACTTTTPMTTEDIWNTTSAWPTTSSTPKPTTLTVTPTTTSTPNPTTTSTPNPTTTSTPKHTTTTLTTTTPTTTVPTTTSSSTTDPPSTTTTAQPTSTTTDPPTSTTTAPPTSTTTAPLTSTTTAPPTTTTVKDPTTTQPTDEYYSGLCSQHWEATDDGTTQWTSPNFDGTSFYPEGDYCCWLNVTIPSHFVIFMVNMIMGNPANIHETSGCWGDRITYYPSDYPVTQATTLCGNLADQSWTETAVFNTPRMFGFQWCSDPYDGGRNIGFNMTITGEDLWLFG